MEALSPTNLRYLIHHVALPPKLPSALEEHRFLGEKALLEQVEINWRSFNVSEAKRLEPISQMLSCAVRDHPNGGPLIKDEVQKSLESLDIHGYRIFYVAAQNAALFIRMESKDQVIIEAFQVSAKNAAVMAATVLDRKFPGNAIAISAGIFFGKSFQTEFAAFLERLSIQGSKAVAAETRKANVTVQEIRDTVKPTYVTSMLMTILEALGKPIKVTQTLKRSKDEVSWFNALAPWRRSPFWLVLRVGLQRSLHFTHGPVEGLHKYKNFVASFFTQIVDTAVDASAIPADLLQFLCAKLSRRVLKLQNSNSLLPEVERKAEAALRKATTKSKEEWIRLRSGSNHQVDLLPRRAASESLTLILSSSGPFLRRILDNPLLSQQTSMPAFDCALRGQATTEGLPEICAGMNSVSERLILLYDVEQWVRKQLHVWSSASSATEARCSALALLLSTYWKLASHTYTNDCAQTSIALLTVLDIWLALDQCTTRLQPLLQEYSPEVTSSLLHPLEIESAEDMTRLQRIEDYIELRTNSSRRYGNPSVFCDPSAKSFAHKYFQSHQGLEMQQLEKLIQQNAEVEAEQKRNEWRSLVRKHKDLLDQANRLACTMTDVWSHGQHQYIKQHSHGCTKCGLVQEADNIEISVFEYPLPEDVVQARTAVFELRCPPSFSIWRDTAWMLLRDIGSNDSKKSWRSCFVTLPDYPALNQQHKGSYRRLTLASEAKSFSKSHYRKLKIESCTIHDVCKPNGLKYEMYDLESGSFAQDIVDLSSFDHHCKLDFSSSSRRRSLLTFVNSTNHSSNEVVANQSQCPTEISVHEWIHFQDLRTGWVMQWPKILRELASVNLDLSTPESTALFRHAALQCGPNLDGSFLRCSHWVFQDKSFCLKLISQIEKALTSIKANWKETSQMETLIILLLRILWLSKQYDEDRQIDRAAQTLLLQMRSSTLRWVRDLHEVSTKSTEIRQADNSAQLIRAAILCRKTFAVSATDENTLLGVSDFSTFMECAIVIFNNIPGEMASMDSHIRQYLTNDFKLALAMEHKFRVRVSDTGTALESAIQGVWPGDRSFEAWKLLSHPNDRWLTSFTRVTTGKRRQQVHFNLFDGQLLIDGLPIGRLPIEYTSKSLYQEVFDTRALDVVPSNLPGMTHALAQSFKGHEVHFGTRNDDLVIRTFRGQSELELIPRTIFQQATNVLDIPHSLVYGCVHWLDLKTGILEIRPLVDKWSSATDNWYLNVRNQVANRADTTLVDVNSPDFVRISTALMGFEHGQQLVVFQPRSANLTVKLPRHNMAFTVNDEGHLKCAELHSIIDPDQNIGVLYGLQTKLVLRDVSSRNRSILIPRGHVTWMRSCGDRVNIKISPIGSSSISFCNYKANTILQRLDPAAEMDDLLYIAYLHALTSHVLADELSGRTGTEEALHCLEIAYLRMWKPLDAASIELLTLIAKLTPKREFYPPRLRTMQVSTWDDQLMAGIQHDDFRHLAEILLAKSRSLLYCNADAIAHPENLDRGSRSLLRRSRAMNFLYRKQNCTIMPINKDFDYPGRDERVVEEGNMRVYETASLLSQWNNNIEVDHDLIRAFESWNTIAGFHQPFRITSLHDLLDLNLGDHFGSLYELCQSSCRQADQYKLLFMFSTMAFGSKTQMAQIRTLIAIAVGDQFARIYPPIWQKYTNFRNGSVPTVAGLVQQITPYAKSFDPGSVPVANMTPSEGERAIKGASMNHSMMASSTVRNLAQMLISQWPQENPSAIGIPVTEYLDIHSAINSITPGWFQLHQNLRLAEFVHNVQGALSSFYCVSSFKPPSLSTLEDNTTPTHRPCSKIPTLSQLLSDKSLQPSYTTGSSEKAHLAQFDAFQEVGRMTCAQTGPTSLAYEKLQKILEILTADRDHLRQEYGDHLLRSLAALRRSPPSALKVTADDLEAFSLSYLIKGHRTLVDSDLAVLTSALQQDRRYLWLELGGLWPTITPTRVLACLSKLLNPPMNSLVKDGIIRYARRITELQRLERIETASSTSAQVKLMDELRNQGHTNWLPSDYPSWLLIEIEANMSLRPQQVEVALEMMFPSSGKNSLLQLNMGQGKSSIILPMIAAVLADTKHIVRIVVPRTLLLQMASVLAQRLCGLLARPLYHIPWSRKTPTDLNTIEALQTTHRKCMDDRGVILAIPEQLLSFKLSGTERLGSDTLAKAKSMIEIQDWLDRFCRDILDESDHTLAVKTQLVYTIGAQFLVDGHPTRWHTSQELLRLFCKILPGLQREYPEAVKVVERGRGGFPEVHILRKEVEDILLRQLSLLVADKAIAILPLQELSKEALLQVEQFVSQPNLRDAAALSYMKDDFSKGDLLLLRGLLAHRILPLTLSKRWNVNYGQHPTRCRIAVPYLAKGVPSSNSEFGHPDVSIVLTCLTYYYSGLSKEQLHESMVKLLTADDPALVYDTWVKACGDLPIYLQSWTSINTDDETQLETLWQHFGYTVEVVNHYLNNFVFPKEAKQFEKKIVTNAWDLVLLSGTSTPSSTSNSSRSMTTGFSGTNDTRSLLPLTIAQHDLESLTGTSAEVLDYLLQERNRHYVKAQNTDGKRLDAQELIRLVTQSRPIINVILDAGAQVVEMSNAAFVSAWLRHRSDAPAALFFDSANQQMIMYQDGRQEARATSRFAEDLVGCLVYFDESRCRGTDLPLPPSTRAALTLGPRETKDHLVQAAMRLRQLAYTQSVVFFAPPEVDQSIRDLQGKSADANIDSSDVVQWLLEQTCLAIESQHPLYLSQGLSYFRRQNSSFRHPEYLKDEEQRRGYLAVIEEPESFTLDEMYNPTSTAMKQTLPVIEEGGPHRAYIADLLAKREDHTSSSQNFHGSLLEEQERELAVELEVERQVERPPSAIALPHLTHGELSTFVLTGKVPPSCSVFHPAFSPNMLKTLSMLSGASFNLGSQLLATLDFHQTVKNRNSDEFQRPVHWILWSNSSKVALLISPFEADYLLPLLRSKSNNHVHLLTYAPATTRRMLCFDSLDFYSIPTLPKDWKAPSSLVRALGLFSGRLYFKWTEYMDLCHFLGQGAPVQEETNGNGQALLPLSQRFVGERNPLPFLWQWLAIRRKGQEYVRTPMGLLIRGRTIAKDDAVFEKTFDYESDDGKIVGPATQAGHQLAANSHVQPGFW